MDGTVELPTDDLTLGDRCLICDELILPHTSSPFHEGERRPMHVHCAIDVARKVAGQVQGVELALPRIPQVPRR